MIHRVFTALAAAVLAATPVLGMQTSQGEARVEPVVTGLNGAWGLDFLPDGGFIFTEIDGDLTLVSADGQATRLLDVPKVEAVGQGGLLDVKVARDFAASREIFLSFAKRGVNRTFGTALAVARISDSGTRLENVRVIFEMDRGGREGRHFGSRVIEAPDGTLFMTIGDRGAKNRSQELDRHNGKIIRVNRDGSIPRDNPFANGGGLPEIWTYGHRNPQGAALDASGQLWTVEHGARGGDEINRIEKGANYGWPVISYGTAYSGAKIGEGTTKPGMEQPAFYWDPSIAPSDMMIYSGKLWPAWRGDIFVGSLKFDYISRLDGAQLAEREQLQSDVTGRIRDVAEAPDGSIWFISENMGAIYRMTPE